MKANNNCTPTSNFIFCLNFALNLSNIKVWFYTNTQINFGFKLSLKLKCRQKIKLTTLLQLCHRTPNRWALNIMIHLDNYTTHKLMTQSSNSRQKLECLLLANAQRNGRPAEYRWRPGLNAAKFGSRPLLGCRAVTLPTGERKTWRKESEFWTWKHSVMEQQQPKMYI